MILFVVYYHVLWLGVKYQDSPSKQIFDLLCMQSFFFVSGFVSVKQFLGIGWNNVVHGIYKKVSTLFIPTVLMFVFCCFYYKLNIVYYLHNEFKNGYWFTYILFQIFVLHYIVCYLLGRFISNKAVQDGIILLFGLFLYFLSVRVYKVLPYQQLRLLSLQFLFKYYLFFVLGYLVNKNCDMYGKIISNTFIKTIVLVIALAPFVGGIEFVKPNSIKLIVSISMVLVIFEMFKKLPVFNDDSMVSRQLSLLGKHSMEIYFIHYYFIFNLPFAMNFIYAQQNYCFRSGGCVFVPEFLIILPVAIVLAY